MHRSAAQTQRPLSDDVEETEPDQTDGEVEATTEDTPDADGGTDEAVSAEADAAEDTDADAEADGRARDDPDGRALRLDRLDTSGLNEDGTAAGQGARQTFDLNAADDDEEDATFGPTLAAWLAAYRARQAAAAAEGAEPPRKVKMAPRPPVGNAAAFTGPRSRPMPPSAHRWAGRAQVALDSMLTSIGTEPPPEWVAVRHRETVRRPNTRWIMVASLTLLMAGTAAVAFVAAARNAGLDMSSGLVAAIFGGAPDAPDTIMVDRPRETAGFVPAGGLPDAQGGPEIAVAPTRIVSASIAGTAPEAPAERRTTVMMPVVTPIGDVEATDHPATVWTARRYVAAADAAMEAIAGASVDAAPSWSIERPGQAPASPAVPQSQAVMTASAGASVAASPAWTIGMQRPGGGAPMSEPAPAPQSTIARGAPAVPASEPDPDMLIMRAETLLETGDVLSARLLYEEAARAGNAEAALGAGMTYDPRFYRRIGARGIEPDASMALDWYTSALGNGEKGAADEIERLRAYLGR